jgi:hypothetical protein
LLLVAGVVFAMAVGTFKFALRPAQVTSVGTPAEVSGTLDGNDFAGVLKSADGSIVLDDTLHFRGGYFWSAGCVRCGFLPGEYWTRRTPDAFEFRGVLGSSERGLFTYEGRIENGVVHAEINWKRVRWYWTVERQYVFDGELSGSENPNIVLKDAWDQAQGEAPPTCPI